MTIARKTAIGVSLAAAAGIAAHLIWPALAIDGATIALLSIGVVPWLAPIFKSVELPGGLKVEYAELEKIQRAAESQGVLPRAAEIPSKRDSVVAVESTDPQLALITLRIEIERKLREIAVRNGIAGTRRSIGPLMSQLSSRGLLSEAQVSVLNDLVPLLNAAAHGAAVDSRAAQWASTVGPQIVVGLDSSADGGMATLAEQYRAADGAAVAEVGEQISRRTVDEPASFLRVMSRDPSLLNGWLSQLGHHTFTLFQARNDTENELFSAFYERLRELMINALSSYTADPTLGEAARKTIESLRTVVIRTID